MLTCFARPWAPVPKSSDVKKQGTESLGPTSRWQEVGWAHTIWSQPASAPGTPQAAPFRTRPSAALQEGSLVEQPQGSPKAWPLGAVAEGLSQEGTWSCIAREGWFFTLCQAQDQKKRGNRGHILTSGVQDTTAEGSAIEHIIWGPRKT